MKSSTRRAILRALYRNATTADPAVSLQVALNTAFDEKSAIVQSGATQRVRTSVSRAGTTTSYSLIGEGLGVTDLELFELYSLLQDLYTEYSTGDYAGSTDAQIYNNMMTDGQMNGISYFTREFNSNPY